MDPVCQAFVPLDKMTLLCILTAKAFLGKLVRFYFSFFVCRSETLMHELRFFFFFFAVFLLNCRFFEQDSTMEQHATGQSHLYFGFLLLQYGPLGLGTFGPHDPACGIGGTYIP